MSCFEIKDSSQFLDSQICVQCMSTTALRLARREKCVRCMRKVKKVDDNQLCRKCSTEKNEMLKNTNLGIKKKDTSLKLQLDVRMRKIKKEMSKIILELMEEVDPKVIPGFEELTYSNIKKDELTNNYSIEELANLVGVLEYMYYNQEKIANNQP